jgi:HSP20 family protein
MANATTLEKCESEVVQAERTRGGRVYRPHVDIIERPDELLLVTDLPGTQAESIDIHFEKGVLSVYAPVDARQDDERTNYVAREYGVGDYARSFQVGEGIDSGKIAAEYTDGVLTLHLPKTAAVMPKKIAVKTT